MIAAESLGLGGVFIGGIRNDPQKVCELLAIPDQVYPVFGMYLGHPAAEPEQKPGLPVDVVLKEETYREDEAGLARYNEIPADYCPFPTLSRHSPTRRSLLCGAALWAFFVGLGEPRPIPNFVSKRDGYRRAQPIRY